MNNHKAQVCKNVIFQNQHRHFDDFGLRNPSIQKYVQRKYATSIVGRASDFDQICAWVPRSIIPRARLTLWNGAYCELLVVF